MRVDVPQKGGKAHTCDSVRTACPVVPDAPSAIPHHLPHVAPHRLIVVGVVRLQVAGPDAVFDRLMLFFVGSAHM